MSETAPIEDPVDYFLEDLTYHGKTERTREAYERVLREFESFIRQERDGSLTDASQRGCMAWVHTLREGRAPSTVASYASYLHRFYGYMTQVGVFEQNPMTLVLEEMEESIDADPARREIMLPAMREFVAAIEHPLDQAVVVGLLKTGMRVGELCNLDLRDLYLDDTEVRETFDTPHRGALDGRPDSLYISSKPSRGTVVNGEERIESNKRRRATVVPVDGELKRVLKRWLAVRPETLAAGEPLFCSTSEWGRRLTIGMVGQRVQTHAADRGWYRAGGGPEENVTPHYFRHFFTTHLRDRTGDRGIVKYLRGDVADDIIDTYTHNWGDRVRETYEAQIYSLL
ncbi:integrase [Halobacteriales archaeon SW_8_65_20]|nr:MAG: integrase [Halobacteriales archaeon SW_6_65_46]PSQ53640.1 MAG: integrase [Halobacteriales archaeon SW_8_65_20]